MATPKKRADNMIKMSALAPTIEEIAQRPYEIFLARGEEPGHDLDDWFQAESELLPQYAARRPVRDN